MVTRAMMLVGLLTVFSLAFAGCEFLEEQGISLDFDSGFTFDWNGLDDFAGSTIYTVLEPDSDEASKLGPLEAMVGEDGTPTLTIKDDFNESVYYDIYYFVDGNDNGACDEGDVDVKGRNRVSPGVVGIGESYIGLRIDTTGICDHFFN